MVIDIKDNVLQEIKSTAFGLFTIQLHDSTDVASCFQSIVFANHVYSNEFKEECFLLFSSGNNCENCQHLQKSFFFLQIRKSLMGKRLWVLYSYVRNQIQISNLRSKAKSKRKTHFLCESSPCTGL